MYLLAFQSVIQEGKVGGAEVPSEEANQKYLPGMVLRMMGRRLCYHSSQTALYEVTGGQNFGRGTRSYIFYSSEILKSLNKDPELTR